MQTVQPHQIVLKKNTIYNYKSEFVLLHATLIKAKKFSDTCCELEINKLRCLLNDLYQSKYIICAANVIFFLECNKIFNRPYTDFLNFKKLTKINKYLKNLKDYHDSKSSRSDLLHTPYTTTLPNAELDGLMNNLFRYIQTLDPYDNLAIIQVNSFMSLIRELNQSKYNSIQIQLFELLRDNNIFECSLREFFRHKQMVKRITMKLNNLIELVELPVNAVDLNISTNSFNLVDFATEEISKFLVELDMTCNHELDMRKIYKTDQLKKMIQRILSLNKADMIFSLYDKLFSCLFIVTDNGMFLDDLIFNLYLL